VPCGRARGNPRGPGLYVVQIRLPRNYRSEAHTHPEEVRTVFVLSGTLYFGFGEEWNEGKLQAFPPGTFFNEPRTMPHFAGTRDEEVVIMVTGMGPTGVIPARPAR
jgi:quercetin dioxygenase-like cupin family protein